MSRFLKNHSGLNEEVAIGYGVQKKGNLTGAVASVSGEELKKIHMASVEQALQGNAAGMNIVSNTHMPGGTVTIQIRGISSINGTTPLFVIDGTPNTDPNVLANLTLTISNRLKYSKMPLLAPFMAPLAETG